MRSVEEYDDNAIKNEAHRIVYKNIVVKLQSLQERKQENFLNHIKDAENAKEKALNEHNAAITSLNKALQLDQDEAHVILDAFKPPK